jgi:hypothetical protein
MDEPVVTDVAHLLDQPVSDRFVDERKARRHGLAERRREERYREVAPHDGRRLHQPTAVDRTALEPSTDDVEHAERWPVGSPRAVHQRAGDLPDEQGVAGGHVENGPGVRHRLAHCGHRQLLPHLGEAEATQVEAIDGR